MRDAMNLSWKLAGVLNGSLPTDVLDTYQRERKPHAVAMIALALAIGYSMTAGGRLGDAIRRLVVPRAPLIPGLAAKVVDSATPVLPVTARRTPPWAQRPGRKPLPQRPHNLRRTVRFHLRKGFSVVTSVHPCAIAARSDRTAPRRRPLCGAVDSAGPVVGTWKCYGGDRPTGLHGDADGS